MRVTVAVALLLAAVPAFAQGSLPNRTPPLRWQRFATGRFSVEMPGRPATQSHMLKALNGRPVLYTTYTVEFARSIYITSTSDYDEETVVSLDRAIDGLLSTWKDPQNLVRRKTMLFGMPAQTVDCTYEGQRVIVWTFLVGRRVYQLTFGEVLGDFRTAHADRFMKSFRLR